jgi:hypothetical protein
MAVEQAGSWVVLREFGTASAAKAAARRLTYRLQHRDRPENRRLPSGRFELEVVGCELRARWLGDDGEASAARSEFESWFSRGVAS